MDLETIKNVLIAEGQVINELQDEGHHMDEVDTMEFFELVLAKYERNKNENM
jgi:hypothetical protein